MGAKIQHPKDRKKLRERRLARGNSAAVNALFSIDRENYVDKPLVFDMNTTRVDDIFDWLISNMTSDNDTYWIKHKEGSNVFQIRKGK